MDKMCDKTLLRLQRRELKGFKFIECGLAYLHKPEIYVKIFEELLKEYFELAAINEDKTKVQMPKVAFAHHDL
jgi:hypothetical protein